MSGSGESPTDVVLDLGSTTSPSPIEGTLNPKQSSFEASKALYITNQTSDLELSKEQKPSRSLPQWLYYVLIAIIGTVILATPAIYVSLKYERPVYWPTETNKSFNSTLSETFRWSILFSVTFLSYLSALSILALIPSIVRAIQYTARRDLLETRTVDAIKHLFIIRHYFAFGLTSFFLWLITSAFFGSASDKSNLIGSALLTQFYLMRTAFAIMLLSWMLLLEKLVIQRVAINYHYDYYANRISDNLFALAVIKKLRRTFPPKGSHIITDQTDIEYAAQIGDEIFEGLCHGGKDRIFPQDFNRTLSKEDSIKFFGYLDQDENGDISKKEMIDGIQNIYLERDLLAQSLASSDDLVRRLDKLGMALVFAALTVLCLPIFDIAIAASIFYISSAALALHSFFGGTISAIFGTIVFIFVNHPFDIGDVILIEKQKFRVKNIGWWTSTFLGDGNKLVYMNNDNLNKMNISNYRRSNPQIEKIKLQVHLKTTRQQISKLEESINEFILRNSRDFQQKVIIAVDLLENDESMRISFGIQHRSNFQNAKLKNQRHARLMENLRQMLSQHDIKLAQEQ